MNYGLRGTENGLRGIIPIYAVILIIVAIGAAGIFVFSARKAAQELNANTAVVNTNTVVTTNTSVGATNTADGDANATNGNVNASAETDATKDWKTFIDTEYSFQVKHPQPWTVIKEINNSTADGGIAFRIKPSNGNDEITIFPRGTQGLGLPSEIERTVTTIGGRSAEKIIYTNSTTGVKGCYFRLLDGPAIWAVGGTNSAAYQNIQLGCEESAIELQILSTFTFTK